MENLIGKQIAERRRALGMTQDQLAERLGVTKQAVSKWENELCYPDITMVPELAEIFGCTTDALFGLNREGPREESVPEEEEKVYWGISLKAPDRENKEKGKPGFELEWHGGKREDLGLALWILLMGIGGLAGAVARNKGMGQPVSYWNIGWTSALLAYGLMGLWPKFSAFRLLCALCGGYFLAQSIFILRVSLNSEMLFPAVLILLGLGLLPKVLKKQGRNSPRTDPEQDSDTSPAER
ncbi:MAG: helix-turn-helix transcriptional regulator [Faecousia sp.]